MMLLAALSGIGLAGACWLLVSGFRPPVTTEARPVRDQVGRLRQQVAQLVGGVDGRRVGLAAVGGLVGLVMVRWPTAVAAGVVAGWCIPLPGKRDARRQVQARTEAIAQWCEMLRDTAGTARGIEGMLVATSASAPAAIAPEVRRMARRLEHEPLDRVLDGLAEDLAHPIGDMLVVALRLAATAGSRRVRSVLDQLAVSASRQAGMRRRVDVARARPRAATRLVALIVAGFVAGLMVFAGDYVAPYGTSVGQLVLVAIAGYWALGFWWMARLGRLPDVPRFIGPAPRPAADGVGARS